MSKLFWLNLQEVNPAINTQSSRSKGHQLSDLYTESKYMYGHISISTFSVGRASNK